MSGGVPPLLGHGAPFDGVLVLVWAFFLFFGILVFWLRREDKREGYPMVDVTPLGKPIEGFPEAPPPKTYGLLYRAGTVQMPHHYADSKTLGQRLLPFPGAPLVPVGNPMLAEIGPGAFPMRDDEPLLAGVNEPQVAPMRVAVDWRVADGDLDPRGLTVFDGRATPVGTVRELWIDKGVKILRYLEVELTLAGAEGERVLVPIYYSNITRRRMRVRVLRAPQFLDIPRTRHPDQVTAREEDRINAYFASGYMFSREAATLQGPPRPAEAR